MYDLSSAQTKSKKTPDGIPKLLVVTKMDIWATRIMEICEKHSLPLQPRDFDDYFQELKNCISRGFKIDKSNAEEEIFFIQVKADHIPCNEQTT